MPTQANPHKAPTSQGEMQRLESEVRRLQALVRVSRAMSPYLAPLTASPSTTSYPEETMSCTLARTASI